MKKISALLAFLALFVSSVVFANSAVVSSATGQVQAQTGTAQARTLRVGDEVRQGDTVITGASSAVVLRFSDGQVAALTANSRMTITAYQYDGNRGNVLLSLIDGGMRAITGFIGRRTPQNVAYRAATATIGIRGTDVTIATANGNVVVSVNDGSISFTAAGRTVTISGGETASFINGVVNQGQTTVMLQNLPPLLAALITTATSAAGQLTGVGYTGAYSFSAAGYNVTIGATGGSGGGGAASIQ